MLERQIKEHPPGSWHRQVEAVRQRPLGCCQCLGIAGEGSRRAAKDVARHLIEQHHQCQRAFRAPFPILEHAGDCMVMVGREAMAHCSVELGRAAKPDLAVMQPLRILGRSKPEIEQSPRALRQGAVDAHGERCSRLVKDSISISYRVPSWVRSMRCHCETRSDEAISCRERDLTAEIASLRSQ